VKKKEREGVRREEGRGMEGWKEEESRSLGRQTRRQAGGGEANQEASGWQGGREARMQGGKDAGRQ